mmetsp:Transcript_69627/g.182537  ORF Transcript_69627/g.182537 Transcript_69627/m.182537 type:complete len:526 (-) Transcript_69627:34-1611(-)
MSPVPMDYFAVGGRPFLLQFPACIGRIVTPGGTYDKQNNYQAAGGDWRQPETGCAKGGDGGHERPSDAYSGDAACGAGHEHKRKPRRRGGGKANNDSDTDRWQLLEAESGTLPGEQLEQLPSVPGSFPCRLQEACEGPINGTAHCSPPSTRTAHFSPPGRMLGRSPPVIPEEHVAKESCSRRPMKEILNLNKVTRVPAEPLHSAFNPKEIKPIDPDRFEMLGKVEDAVRNCGKVLLMRDRVEDKLVAVKRMPNEWVRECHSDFVKAYPGETELPWQDIGCNRFLNEVGYQYGCNLLGVYRNETHTDVVMDLASEGDMFRWCEGHLTVPPGPEREAMVRPLARQMIEGVQQLHDMSIVHRDLSLENILLTVDDAGRQTIKLIDFGMATTQRRCINENRGKQSYQAPEMHIGKLEYDCFYQDSFSLGVVIFGMAAADYPWYSTRSGKCQLWDFYSQRGLQAFLERRKARKGNLKLVEVFSPHLMALLIGMVQILPEERLTLGESCFDAELGDNHTSVWDMDWLHEWS